jgi:chromate reductase, NAD(P)H dehydrogenase (quinone)
MRILGVSGSVRRNSYNTALLRAAARLLPPGAELVEFEGLKAIPAFCEDDEAQPGVAVDAFREAIASADAVLVATPEFNSSIPGTLKNALDWASRPASESALLGKPVAVIGASTSIFGAVWAQAETRRVLKATGARVIDRELTVASAATAFTPDRQLAAPELQTALSEILLALRTPTRPCPELAAAMIAWRPAVIPRAARTSAAWSASHAITICRWPCAAEGATSPGSARQASTSTGSSQPGSSYGWSRTAPTSASRASGRGAEAEGTAAFRTPSRPRFGCWRRAAAGGSGEGSTNTTRTEEVSQ